MDPKGKVSEGATLHEKIYPEWKKALPVPSEVIEPIQASAPHVLFRVIVFKLGFIKFKLKQEWTISGDKISKLHVSMV